MSSGNSKTIDGAGYPLAFKMRQGNARPAVLGGGAGDGMFKVEAHQLAGHQKEALVTEGASGSLWRMTSDEGPHLKGTDLAPFPLGFFNAGLHADLLNRLLRLAQSRGILLEDLTIALRTGYSMTGSFARGDGQGYAEPADIVISARSSATADAVRDLVQRAVQASPALAAMRMPLENTFAIYVNSRRQAVTTLPPSQAPEAADPFKTYQQAPQPLAGSDDLPGIIAKTTQKRAGTVMLAPAAATPGSRIIRMVGGVSTPLSTSGITETDAALEMPGMSHFTFKSDERADKDQAPSGLAFLSAGIAFCYMTQLSRYIEHMKLRIRAVRLVQYTPFTLTGSAVGEHWGGGVKPVDTHLFLNGEEDEATHEKLMQIAARTCYLHATLADALQPQVRIVLNGSEI